MGLSFGFSMSGLFHYGAIRKGEDSGYSQLVFSLCRECLPISHVVVRPLSEDTVLFQGMRIVSLHR